MATTNQEQTDKQLYMLFLKAEEEFEAALENSTEKQQAVRKALKAFMDKRYPSGSGGGDGGPLRRSRPC